MTAFTEQYVEHLEQSYPHEIVAQITDEDNWQQAPVPNHDDETVPYVVVEPKIETEDTKTFLYVPGFVEGIVNKASFAAELANRGHRVILPDQNRLTIAKSAFQAKSATEFQAGNYLSVLEHAKSKNASLDGGGVDVLARSYGGLVFDAMSKRTAETDADHFANSKVFLLASAGLIENETWSSLVRRWAGMMQSEMSKKGRDFPDIDGSTGKASLQTMMANVSRTFREADRLVNDKISLDLPDRVGRLAIVDYAEDRLFPSKRTAAHVGELVARGAVWLTPVSLQSLDGNSSHIRGGHGAVHDDEQLNPSRVAGAIDYYLKHVA